MCIESSSANQFNMQLFSMFFKMKEFQNRSPNSQEIQSCSTISDLIPDGLFSNTTKNIPLGIKTSYM